MMKWLLVVLFPVCLQAQPQAWIRINQLGYTPGGGKVAVWCMKEEKEVVTRFHLVNAVTQKKEYSGTASKNFGAYGPFKQTFRLDFSAFKKPGRYYIQTGETKSPEFEIGDDVYKGAADFCLRYMRQQRSGFNPYLKDSCHTHDGYVLYGEKAGIKDSTYIDVVGGWHDASDYLQYSTTSANATWHLLAAYRDFPNVFTDTKQSNGLDGKNGMPDVLDEAKWGLDWLLKMHPKENVMFNQVGDDRDHINMRIPKEDTQYGRGFQRPVYFVSGEPQQRGKFMNATTGTSSTAGKFASAFGLGYRVFFPFDKNYAWKILNKAYTAKAFGEIRKGVSQTASVKSPYIYAEDNWTDDMELGCISIAQSEKTIISRYKELIDDAYRYAKQDAITTWLKTDTAKHYQWYPFINAGHYEIAKTIKDKRKDTLIGYYKQGIEHVWNRAKQNAFYRGVPYIWCSNNLTTSFAIQCYWYRELTGDKQFAELEQANIDWLFGCNPWGTSMVYGLPAWGDTPVDPHSAFTHLKNYPIDGGLVDGPVYTNIYKGLIGIKLTREDAYAAFQSDLAVYHDDYGDYSTNEPTMDGTASLIYLLAAQEAASQNPSTVRKDSLGGGALKSSKKKWSYNHNAVIRGDSTQRNIAFVFTGHEYAEGGDYVQKLLKEEKIKASFFFTGEFYRNPSFKNIITTLNKQGHYLGAHSDKHLLYCDWTKRDSLLVSRPQFRFDLADNYTAMARHKIKVSKATYFLPPYEWYNDSIATWTKQLNLQLINYTPGTLSHADYTTEADKAFRSSETIYQSIMKYEAEKPAGLNGFILLMHIGAGPERKDKFYERLPRLISYLKAKGYHFQRIDELLSQ